MQRKTGMALAFALVAISQVASVQVLAAKGADYPWGSSRPDAARVIRKESPRMTRQPADTGQFVPLYEAWMVEVFCDRRGNQRRFDDSRADCIRGTGGEPAERCSAKLRARVPKAYSDGDGDGDAVRHTFAGFVRAYQVCLRRGSGPAAGGHL